MKPSLCKLKIVTCKLIIALTVAAAALSAQAPQPTRERIDVSKLGPQVGARVPDFRLKDQHGKEWTRESIAGPKGAMLVFLRSADW